MQAKSSTRPRRRAVPSPTRALVPLPALDTPDPLKFPLTGRYLADGAELRPAAVYLRESERRGTGKRRGRVAKSCPPALFSAHAGAAAAPACWP